MSSVGRSLPHDSAHEHATGAARFVADIPRTHGELFVDYAGSPCARGRIERIDLAEAAKIEGVVALLTHTDVPGAVLFGPMLADEPFLARDRVVYLGQPVVVIAAESLDAAVQAKQAVRIEVEEEEPVLTIDEAIQRDQFIGAPLRLARGEWPQADHQLEGTLNIGGQEHLYLESQAAIAYPGERHQIKVHSSTQNPTELQATIAAVLGLGMHEIVCECNRMGGAFGGKETQAALPALMVALVAHRTRRSARIVYSMAHDMAVSGKRHPYRSTWKVAFDGVGRLLGVRMDFYSNGGCAADLSLAVLQRSLYHADNAYYLENVELNGRVCRTNLPPNTAFRGFGAPQAVAVIENILEEIAIHLDKDAFEVRRLNCYGVRDRNVTPYGQVVRENHLPEVFDRLAVSSAYHERRAAIQRFNGSSRSYLKGISLTAVKFGISFTTRFHNQANALVNLYTDGTVQVSTGATEMGQGVNTKIRQLVADEFGIPVDRVRMMATSTEKNNNTSPTAASASTDLNGTAAVRACERIRRRLAGFAADLLDVAAENIRFDGGAVFDDRDPEHCLPFAELAHRARRARIDLGARGFYATPGLDQAPYHYFTTGCAVAEVLVDRFTGELTTERVDLLMDVGRMINPGVDVGQVIGGFVQGMGWVTTEELRYNGRGGLLSGSPTTYKVPAVTDVPEIFNVDFVDSDRNVTNIRSSKAVGEPPLLLGISVWTAVKHALSFVRPGEIPPLDLPATGERILAAITDLRVRLVNTPTRRR